MIFIVDNYDSFTYNLVQAVGKFDPDVVVARNDRFDSTEVLSRRPRAVVGSPADSSLHTLDDGYPPGVELLIPDFRQS